ncbi:hypothetical protein G9A89_004327 [Geosiphon pyriformis]|nr:hypothetical protein G9A89_004327 [Geosiphon pyriformis]
MLVKARENYKHQHRQREEFNLRSSTPSGLQSLPPPPDFGIFDLWEAAESEKEEEESEDQEFTYQHPIIENPEEIETLNHQRQNNPNPKLINQQNLLPVIVIDQLPINPIAELIQQPLQLPPQQPVQQQLFQQPPQLPNLDPMAYTPITKLDNFTGEEDDTQVWLNDDTADSWYQSLINKPQDFNAFKMEFLRYFSNNNSINCLVNTFTTIKQGETEAITTYLGPPQILNYFIHGLCSSILQHVCSLHPGILQDAVTHTRDFESIESEVNHAQAINLVMNGSSELDSKLEKFSKSINKRLEEYLADNHAIYHGNRKCVSATIVVNKNISKLTVASEINNKIPLLVSNSESVPKSKPIRLPTSDVVISLSVSGVSSSNLSTTATSDLSTTAATNNLSVSTINSNTTPKFSYDDIKKPKTQNCSKLEISDDCSSTDPQFLSPKLRISFSEFGYWHHPTPKFPKLFKIRLTDNTYQQHLTNNAALKERSIAVMYTDAKVDKHPIKLILDSNQLGHQVDWAASAHIITANGATKTPIGEIDNFLFEVNGIITPIKVLVMEAPQYQALVGNDWLFKTNIILDWMIQKLQLSDNGQHTYVPTMCGHFKVPLREKPLIELEEEKKPIWKAFQDTIDPNWYVSVVVRNCQQWAHAVVRTKNRQQQLNTTVAHASLNVMDNCQKWENGTGTPINNAWKQTLRRLEGYPHNKDEIWRMAYVMSEGATTEKLREIKDNPLSLPKPEYIQMFDIFGNIKDDPEEFHEHYQRLASTRKEQEEHLAQLNTQLCDHCLILCDFQYCNECNLIYNPPQCIIYMIPKEKEPISSCTSELESLLNSDSNSDNNDNNNGLSSVQNSNDNDNDSNSDPNSNTNYEQYIVLPNLFKEQKLNWYSDKREGIMSEHTHDTDAGFDLRYPKKDAIKLEPHSHTCIDLKVALEILTTTMVQLASRSSLAKREINIRGGIIDMGYVENIITMLQNDSEKTYIIEPNKKIAQTIFLPLVRVAQLVSVGKKEELGITTREIQGFGSTGRIDVPVNMVEKEIIGQGEIISTGQAIFIPLYSQYILAIGRKKKEQGQIFEAEANLCKSGEIGLINLHIPAKSYSSIKILIYNNTGNVINIPEGTTIGYLTTEIEDQPPNPIPDFPQLCEYVDITLQTIYG